MGIQLICDVTNSHLFMIGHLCESVNYTALMAVLVWRQGSWGGLAKLVLIHPVVSLVLLSEPDSGVCDLSPPLCHGSQDQVCCVVSGGVETEPQLSLRRHVVEHPQTTGRSLSVM